VTSRSGAALRISAIVPAAGRAVRFGGGKLLTELRGEPLLNHTLRSLLDGGAAEIVVVTGDTDLSAVPLVKEGRVSLVRNPDPNRGMFSSIQAGTAQAGGDVLLVLPGDMPFVSAATIAAVATECAGSGDPVVPAHHGRRGHPLALPGSAREVLLAADATTTLKEVLQLAGWRLRELPVQDPGVLRDVDVRGDLE
jgi:molybdenum cofactor cytidylyltransferase